MLKGASLNAAPLFHTPGCHSYPLFFRVSFLSKDRNRASKSPVPDAKYKHANNAKLRLFGRSFSAQKKLRLTTKLFRCK